MISSAMFEATYQGQPAQLYVIRNDGFCWGRLVLQDGTELDVYTGRDYYNYEDFVAAEAFERAAKRGKVEPAQGWKGFEWVEKS